jgi:hypothetical protein
VGAAAPRGQRATEGADHGLQVQVLLRELRRGRAADHPGPLPGCVSGDRDTAAKRRLQARNTRHSRGDQAGIGGCRGRMSESSQRVGTGRTPLPLRNKETIVPGDLQCLNHRSCENVLLIPPPRVPPGPRSSPAPLMGPNSRPNGFRQQTDQKRTKHKPFSVCTTPGSISYDLQDLRNIDAPLESLPFVRKGFIRGGSGQE